MWVGTATEGGRGFMDKWRKYEVDGARNRQEKKEVTTLVVVVFTLKAVPLSTQYFLTSVLVQLTRTPSVVTG